MILYPAIDIYQGEAVRLRQGSFEDKTTYQSDPLVAALDWVDAGAKALHVVDLDGAKEGRPVNVDQLERIVSGCNVPVQIGGGLRSIDAVQRVFEAGAQRAIIGTAALTDLDLLDSAVEQFGDQIAVALDARAGKLATEGWLQTTDLSAVSVIKRLAQRGVKSFIYTSIDRDGMLEGPDLDEVVAVASEVKGKFIYSGGIGTLDHLKALVDLRQVNLSGVIVGKALYERRFTVAEAITALKC